MKCFENKILFYICIIVTTFSNAQTIYNITDVEPELGSYNYYMKDINYKLNPFVGTWVYTNGNTSITMVLKKKERFQSCDCPIFEDIIYGEYRFVENGVQVLNYLPRIDSPNINNYFEYSITGNYFPSLNVFSSDPSVTGNVLDLGMSEPNDVGSTLQMYVTTVNGQIALQVYKADIASGHQKGTPHYYSIMPSGELTFIKQ